MYLYTCCSNVYVFKLAGEEAITFFIQMYSRQTFILVYPTYLFNVFVTKVYYLFYSLQSILLLTMRVYEDKMSNYSLLYTFLSCILYHKYNDFTIVIIVLCQ